MAQIRKVIWKQKNKKWLQVALKIWKLLIEAFKINIKKLSLKNSPKTLQTVCLPGRLLMIFGRSTLVGQRPMKSLSSVCLSVTKFSQDWII